MLEQNLSQPVNHSQKPSNGLTPPPPPYQKKPVNKEQANPSTQENPQKPVNLSTPLAGDQSTLPVIVSESAPLDAEYYRQNILLRNRCGNLPVHESHTRVIGKRSQ